MLLGIILAAALLALGMLLLKTEGLLRRRSEAYISFIVLLAAVAARLLLRSPDGADNAELSRAIAWFSAAGGLPGLKNSLLPYPLPVQFFMALLSVSPEHGALLFKILCLFFELFAAWSCQRCVSSITTRAEPRLLAFLAVMLLPSGAAITSLSATGEVFGWAFLLWSCALALETRPALSALALGCALAFQPGLIWIAPTFFVFPVLRREPGLSLVSLAGGYFGCAVPFILLGRSGNEIFPFYPLPDAVFPSGFAGNTPGLYSLLPGWPDSPAGVVIYAALLLICICLLCRKRTLRNKRAHLAGICFAACAAVAFLPRQGSYMLYGCDLLCLALCCAESRLLPTVLLSVAAGGIYLWKDSVAVLRGIPAGWLILAEIAILVLLMVFILFPGGSGGRKRKKVFSAPDDSPEDDY